MLRAGRAEEEMTLKACVLVTQPGGKVDKEVRTFSTMTDDLLLLSDWLDSLGVAVVAMESTGVYWKPVFNILEEGREVMLVNAEQKRK